MICSPCETKVHYKCIDCKNDHKSYLCLCPCHDETTKPHANQ